MTVLYLAAYPIAQAPLLVTLVNQIYVPQYAEMERLLGSKNVMLVNLKDANQTAHQILRTFYVQEETLSLQQYALK